MLLRTDFHYICYQISIVIKQIDAGTASSKGALWAKFSKYISIIFNAILALFWCKKGKDLIHIIVGKLR